MIRNGDWQWLNELLVFAKKNACHMELDGMKTYDQTHEDSINMM